MAGCSPRLRVIASLGAAGVSSGTMVYHSSIENPLGFHRFMYSVTEYSRTGLWPTLSETQNAPVIDVNRLFDKAVQQLDANRTDEILKNVVARIEKGDKFLGDDYTNLVNQFIDKMFTSIMNLLQPTFVEGFLDDLIGQQLIIHIILFFILISLILLIITYFINILILFNKDFILNKFKNKYIRLFINYESFLTKLTLIILPFFIILGLIILFHGFYFLISHQIPYHNLGIDLHVYVSSPVSHPPLLPLETLALDGVTETPDLIKK